MKRLMVSASLLLLGVIVGVLIRSNRGPQYTPKGQELEQDHVTVHNCVATPDSVIVRNNRHVRWEVRDDLNDPDKGKYIVSFESANAIGGDIPIFSSNLPDVSHTVNTGCSTIGSGCGRFPYRLVRLYENEKAVVCDDPGIHVVPPSFFSFLRFW
jgi:hypothetical protein